MALYVIGDLHLSLGADKPMDVFGGKWVDYIDKISDNWRGTVKENDTVVLTGDTSWSMSLSGIVNDFRFIDELPGEKIILKGNHDYWWTSISKMNRLLTENNMTTISFLHNNYYKVGEIAVCGSRGWFVDEDEADIKILNREVMRLETSIKAAPTESGERIAFLHYPVSYDNYICKPILNVLKQNGIKRCYFGHLHGQSIYRLNEKIYDGIEMNLVSCDAVNFMPQLVEV